MLIFFCFFAVANLLIQFFNSKEMDKNQILDKYLSSLSESERIAKSRDIREKLGISRFVLSNWRSGRTKIHPLFFDKISEIIGIDLQKQFGN